MKFREWHRQEDQGQSPCLRSFLQELALRQGLKSLLYSVAAPSRVACVLLGKQADHTSASSVVLSGARVGAEEFGGHTAWVSSATLLLMGMASANASGHAMRSSSALRCNVGGTHCGQSQRPLALV